MKNYLEQNADKIEVVGIKKIKMPSFIFNSKTIDLIDAEIVNCKAIKEITIEGNVVKTDEEFNLIAFYPANNYKYLPCFEKNVFDFQKVKSELMLYSLSTKPESIEENLFLLGNSFFFISLAKSLNNGIVGKDGYTPIKGIDYFDGKDGRSLTFEDLLPNEIELLKGADGRTPIKGIDYFDGKDGKPLTFADLSPTEVELLKGADGYTPIKGIDYFDGKDGKPLTFADLSPTEVESLKGADGYTPIKGIDYFDGKDGKPLTFADLSPTEVELLKGADGRTPIKGIDYFDGKDGKPLTFADLSPTEVESLKGADGYTPIKGIDYFDGKDGKPLTFADLSPTEVELLKGADGYTPIKGIDYFDGESIDLDSINRVAVHFEVEGNVVHLNEYTRKNIIYFDKIGESLGDEMLHFENANFKDGDEIIVISSQSGNLQLNNFDETLENKEVLQLSVGTTRLLYSSELNSFLKV